MEFGASSRGHRPHLPRPPEPERSGQGGGARRRGPRDPHLTAKDDNRRAQGPHLHRHGDLDRQHRDRAPRITAATSARTRSPCTAKPGIPGSSDPAFRGDRARYNPEEMLVASLSACHMLWYLHLCSAEGIVVQAYQDIAEGVMVEEPGGGGRFTEVVLQPEIAARAGAECRAGPSAARRSQPASASSPTRSTSRSATNPCSVEA